MDVSEYALENVRDDLKPYRIKASVTDPHIRRYDLITCIETLAHLRPLDGKKAIAIYARTLMDVFFSSTPRPLQRGDAPGGPSSTGVGVQAARRELELVGTTTIWRVPHLMPRAVSNLLPRATRWRAVATTIRPCRRRDSNGLTTAEHAAHGRTDDIVAGVPSFWLRGA